MSNEYLGRGGRLRGGPAPELVAAGYAAEVGHGPRLAEGLSQSDLAHAVTLVESGAIAAETGRRLLDGLLELDAIDPRAFPWCPELGDAFNSREAELRRRVGAAAGWLSAGRPRREAFRVALRLVARDGLLRLHAELTDLVDALCDQAALHAGALAADYTYLQPAQPTTLGHLVLAYAYPAVRDAERVQALHGTLDLSVAGAGGSAGSRWPLDRARLAELLGCRDVVVHTKDAMWQADVYIELLGTLATGATHRSQLAQDLEILASQEFGVAELADAHSRASALMPQKRNPYALAVLRTHAAQASGDLAGALVALHTGSARTDHFHLLNGSVPRMLEEATESTRLAAEVVAGLTLDPEPLADAARRGFTVAADIADLLAQGGRLDYRSAHHVVGRAVRELVEAGMQPQALTVERLAAAAEAHGVEAPDVAPKDLAAALDPRECLATRAQRGGPSPTELQAMVDECRTRAAEGRAWRSAAEAHAAEARARLHARARTLAEPGPARSR